MHVAGSFTAHSSLCVSSIFFIFLHNLLLKLCLHSHVMPLIQSRVVCKIRSVTTKQLNMNTK